MNRKNRFTAFACIAAMLAGCAKEAPVPVTDVTVIEDDSEVDVIEGPVSVTAGLPGKDTKTTYSYDEGSNVMKVAWEKGDQIFSYGNNQQQQYSQDGEMTGDGKFASFKKTSGTLRAGKTYLFSYPYVMGTSSTNGSFVLSGQTGAIEDMKNYDILTAKVAVASDGNIPEISFSRRVAWMKITNLDFGKDVNTNITKIYLNGKVFNDFMFVNKNNDFAETIKCRTVTTVTPAAPVEVKDGKQTKDLYVAFFPSTDAAKGDECTLTVMTSDNVTYQVVWETASAYTAGMMYALTGNIEKTVSYNIEFKDPLVKSILTSQISPVDINKDGEISNVEAGVQTSLSWLFESSKITSFDEFVYFTGITRFDGNNSGDNGGFKNCKELTSIKLPASIVEIGSDAFNGCGSLKNIEIPSSVAKINAGAFKDCASLESITIPDGVTYMGQGLTFYGCSSLKTIHWPKACKEIGGQSFQNCTSLETMEFPEDLEAIGTLAFSGCTSLKSLAVPASVTTIGIKAFNNCTNLSELTFNGAKYRLDANKNLVLEGTKAISCLGVTATLTIPEEVTELANQSCSELSKVTEVVISGNPTFGSNVFANNAALKKVTFGNTCTSTGNNTFTGCTSLEDVQLSNGITALGTNLFSGCTSLRNITLPSSITVLNNGVFNGCTSLESIAFPKGMTKIPNDILKGCSSLKSVGLEEGITEIGNNSFNGCSGITSFNLPASLTKIGASAFANCTGLTEIKIPESVTSLGSGVFSGCTGITSLTIPEGVTTIPSNMVSGCTNLETLNLPSKITTIPTGAFKGTGLKTIGLPESLTQIPSSLFQNCVKLESIVIPAKVTTIGSSAFAGCTSLKGVNIPDPCTKIDRGAFDGSGLESIDVNNVTDVTTAFSNCKNLKSITLRKVINIANQGFSGCSALTSITIPATVTKVNAWAFAGCSSLKEIIFESSTPCTVSSTSFTTSALAASPATYVDAIYVPDNAVDAYKTANVWSNYWASYIFAVSTK